MIDKIDDDFLMVNRGHIYETAMGSLEKLIIEKALEKSFGNKIIAAKILGIHRNTLYTKVKKLCINSERYKI
ncbi:MAG: helix-turn-helix domain-containing protein [Candidatus Omnitrophota bacterium]